MVKLFNLCKNKKKKNHQKFSIKKFFYEKKKIKKYPKLKGKDKKKNNEKNTSSKGFNHASSSALEIPKNFFNRTRIVGCTSVHHQIKFSHSLSFSFIFRFTAKRDRNSKLVRVREKESKSKGGKDVKIFWPLLREKKWSQCVWLWSVENLNRIESLLINRIW